MNLRQWLVRDEASEVRFFSLARHALLATLNALPASRRILLPEYICRDLLASVHLAQKEVCWYSVGQDLAPVNDPKDWPVADFVLAANYFGFPQNMAPFREYADRTGAVIVEDNAHGFLGCDDTGQPLGSRGDVGLFSLRKTFLLGTGAALVVRHRQLAAALEKQLPAEKLSPPPAIRVRRLLRAVTRSRQPERYMAAAVREIRRKCFGYTIRPPDDDAERAIPLGPAPSCEMFEYLEPLDFAAEVRRRRDLYQTIVAESKSTEWRPVFPHLPIGTVPYGLPVYCEDIRAIEAVGRHYACDVFRWPDLPDAIARRAPKHYRNMFLVNFL